MNLKTTLHRYRFDLSKPAEKKAYTELSNKLSSEPGRYFFNVLGPMPSEKTTPPPEGATELETAHLFADQWNSTTHRVFDWYEAIYPNRHIKDGYYLDITDEMRELRRNTLICGYCGKNYPPSTPPAPTFCTACLDSPYLKESELHLLRLLPVALKMPRRDPLTDVEKAELMPAYVKRQTEGSDSRAYAAKVKQRENIIKKYIKLTSHAKIEQDGMLWLMDHGIDVDNVIYYDHTGFFSFGWRSGIGPEVRKKLNELLKDFPFKYEIKEPRI